MNTMAVSGSGGPLLRPPPTGVCVAVLLGGVLSLSALAWVLRSLPCLGVAAAVVLMAYPGICSAPQRCG